MNTRFYNARILLSDGKRDFLIGEGELWVENSIITCVGTPEGTPPVWDREIDCGGNLLMPGFKNMHTHSAMTFLRSYADNYELDVWLNEHIFPMETKLTPELIYRFTVLAIMEYLTSGITTNFDMYFNAEVIAKAAVDTGFRTVQTSSLSMFQSSLEEQERDYYTVNGMSELTSYVLGIHSEYIASKEIFTGVAALADRLKSGVWFHNSETQKEVLGCKERWGKTPTQIADEYGLFKYGGGGYHCVWVEDCDYEIFKKRGLTAVLNPASNLKLNSGIAPIKRFLDEGVNLAIGTDGAASNNCLDMFREMFLVASLSKIKENNACSVSASDVLYMATTGGANSVGLYDCNCIAVGKKADIIMLDLHQPNMQPDYNIVGNIVYSGSKQNVVMTMVNGKILYENGRFNIGIEPKDVYGECRAILKSICSDM